MFYLLSGQPTCRYDKENVDWAPSLKLGHNSFKKVDRKRKERYDSIKEKRRKTASAQALLELQKAEFLLKKRPVKAACCDATFTDVNEAAASTDVNESSLKSCEISTQTDTKLSDIQALEAEVKSLRDENSKLKEDLKEVSLNEMGFRENDEKVVFYTGLPSWNLLYCLYNFILPYLSQSTKCTLSPFQRLMLTLMRLRLNLSGKDLAYRFGGVHETTVSRTFLNVLDVLHQRLKPLIYWPDRESLLKTLPMDFRKHCPGCAVIIDCFEIFLDRASNPLARGQTYSSYKHHNTVKYLIGVTPQGSVSFISDGWGGRVSDKHLTEESGLLENLLPGDVILADRGFDISESVGLFCARIKIPAFTKGRKQLSGIEVEQTRRIANVRIHVERVIGNIRKKYGILSATQPIDFAVVRDGKKTTLDKIVTVSCALTNLCDSVIPFE